VKIFYFAVSRKKIERAELWNKKRVKLETQERKKDVKFEKLL
jgi:hypothetical protein